MSIDTDKIDEAVLALLQLTVIEDHGSHRTWKGHDWGVLERLYEKGYISDPVGKHKSVAFTDEGLKKSKELFAQKFTK